MKIGIDPNWYPLDFGGEQPYVNGFVEDLLLEISKHSGIRFEKMTANWDALYQQLQEHHYDAVLSDLPLSTLHLVHYDTSGSLLDLGPVIVAAKKKKSPFVVKEGALVGFISEEEAMGFLKNHPNIIVRQYDSPATLLTALANGNIEQAVLNILMAHAYVSDLFADQLHVSSKPLTERGIRLVVMKGEHEEMMRKFNQSLSYLKKKKKVDGLLKKWNLIVD